MQFLPEVREIYISRLRNHIHNSISKCGVNEKMLRSAKKINIHSILHSQRSEIPTDIALYCSVLLYSSQAQLFAKEKTIDIKIFGEGTFLADRRLICAILCEMAILASNGGEILVNIEKRGVRISYKGAPPNNTLKRLVCSHKAVMLKIEKSGIHSVFLRLKPTRQKSEKITGAVSLLTDPLSPIKIFTTEL